LRRLNKLTGLPYKSGDQPTEDDLPFREGKLFFRYEKVIKKNGYFIEKWKTPEQLKILKEKSKKFKSENIKRHFESGDGKLELNPETKQKWKTGEKCPKRGYFRAYQKYVRKDGYFQMIFYKNFELYEKQRIRMTLSGKPKKCRDNSLPYDLDLDYVLGIFPKDYVCPMLKIKMSWGGGKTHRSNSPSLDRIKPSKGYIKGNVAWISNRANMIKHDATFKEFEMLYEWFKSVRLGQKGTI